MRLFTALTRFQGVNPTTTLPLVASRNRPRSCAAYPWSKNEDGTADGVGVAPAWSAWMRWL